MPSSAGGFVPPIGPRGLGPRGVGPQGAGQVGRNITVGDRATAFSNPTDLSPLAWWDVHLAGAVGQTVTDQRGGTVATLGSTGGTDTNDPMWLSWSGSDYVYLTGVTGNWIETPDTVALRITGDLDVSVRFVAGSLDLTTPTKPFIGKQGTLGDAWLLRYHAGVAAAPEFVWWTGTAYISTNAGGYRVGTSETGLRVTLQVNDGSSQNVARFYSTTDALSVASPTWTLQNTVTTAGVTSIYPGQGKLMIGSEEDAAGREIIGGFTAAQVKSGIGGTVVADFDASKFTAGSAVTYTDTVGTNGGVWTITRSSAGRKAEVVKGRGLMLLGTDDLWTVPSASVPSFGTATAGTVTVVGRPWPTPLNNGRWFDNRGSATETVAGVGIRQNGTASSLVGTMGDGTSAVTTAPVAYTDGQLVKASLIVDTTTFKLRVNGTESASVARPAGSATGTTGIVGAATTAAANPAEFASRALLTFNRALSSADAAALESYYEATTPDAGLASATGTANNPSISVAPNAGLAAGTGTADNATVAIATNAGAASGTGTANNPAPAVAPNAALASGTGTANNPGVSATFTAGSAAATGTANNPGVSATFTSGAASATGTANNPKTTVAPNAVLASGSGAANAPGVSATFTAGSATGTGTANGPPANIQPNAGAASGTGTANNPGTNAAFTAGAASGSGTAYNPGVLTGTVVTPSTATAAGTANNPGASATFTAGTATAVGTANDPTVTRAATATASTATATGTANNPATASAVTAWAASGAATANNASANPAVNAASASATATSYGSAPVTSRLAAALTASATGTAFNPTAQGAVPDVWGYRAFLEHLRLTIAAATGRQVFIARAEGRPNLPFCVVHLFGHSGSVEHSLAHDNVVLGAYIQIDGVGRTHRDAMWMVERAVDAVRQMDRPPGVASWQTIGRSSLTPLHSEGVIAVARRLQIQVTRR